MKFFDRVKRFRNAEDGTMTVDWIVLTAALIGLGVAVMVSFSAGESSVSNQNYGISNQNYNAYKDAQISAF